MRAGTALWTLAAVALTCGGCGSVSGPYVAKTVPAKGTITYQGKPLTQGTITFEPTDAGREAHGTIQPDGTFVLSTFKPDDGALVGPHRIAVMGTGKKGKEVVPRKFLHTSSSKVEVEISDGKTEYPIDLK